MQKMDGLPKLQAQLAFTHRRFRRIVKRLENAGPHPGEVHMHKHDIEDACMLRGEINSLLEKKRSLLEEYNSGEGLDEFYSWAESFDEECRFLIQFEMEIREINLKESLISEEFSEDGPVTSLAEWSRRKRSHSNTNSVVQYPPPPPDIPPPQVPHIKREREETGISTRLEYKTHGNQWQTTKRVHFLQWKPLRCKMHDNCEFLG